jgi:hypothetical protein
LSNKLIRRFRAENIIGASLGDRRASPLVESAMRIRALVLHSATVTFSSKWKIKVTLRSRKPAAPPSFPSAVFCFADKSRQRRVFFCALKQGNSRGRLRNAIPSYGHAAAFSRNVREVSGAAKMHLKMHR